MGLKCGGIKGLVGVGRIGGRYGRVFREGEKYRRCGEGRVAAAF